MKDSKKFTLNKADIQRWLTNTLIFAGPALLVLLASAAKIVPTDSQYAVVALFVINVATDLLKKYLAGK